MKGLKGYIRDNLPESWEHVLRKHKLINKFVNYMYQSIPLNKRGSKISDGRPGWKRGITLINCCFNNYKIYQCIDHNLINDSSVNWKSIHNEIVEYENNCR